MGAALYGGFIQNRVSYTGAIVAFSEAFMVNQRHSVERAALIAWAEAMRGKPALGMSSLLVRKQNSFAEVTCYAWFARCRWGYTGVAVFPVSNV
jgi:hypothetical protein